VVQMTNCADSSVICRCGIGIYGGARHKLSALSRSIVANVSREEMRVGLIIAIGVAVLLLVFGIGFGIGRSSSKTASTNPGENDQNITACRGLCDQWYRRRSDLCSAEANEAAARRSADSIRTEMTIALIAAGGLAAAAAAALIVPISGWIAAAALFTAAGIAAALAGYLTGLLNRADENVNRKQEISRVAREHVSAALQLLLAGGCPQTELDSCLNRPSPCPS
jgi:hypothetical protein